jgi:ectoine hydroxylase-related dioxygenase (phytanoyl-CoA dioxygenase family)
MRVTPPSAAERHDLDVLGFVALEALMSPELLRALRERVEALFAREGDAAGSEFRAEPGSRRLANCVDKGQVFQRLILEPVVLGCMAHVLGPRFKLSSLNVRSALPHNEADQPLHCDTGALPDELGYTVANSVWMLDDFTADNGAIRVVPGSHRWGHLPHDVLADPQAPHPEQALVTGRAGTVVVINAHLWHGGTANRTDAERRAAHAFYTRWDKPQQQYQKRLLSPPTLAALSDEARRLLALDDPLNDELCTRETGMSGFLR